MQLKFEHAIDYEAWSKKLLFACLLLVPVGLVFASMGIFVIALLQPPINLVIYAEVWAQYALFPALACLVVMLLVFGLSMLLLGANKGGAQVRVFLAGLSIWAFILAGVFSANPIFTVMFCLPMLLAVTYIDKRLIWFAFACSVACYAAMVAVLDFAAPAFTGLHLPSSVDVFYTCLMLVVGLVISLVINHRQILLINTMDAATDKTWRDSLTGLYNHKTFYHQLELLMEQSKKRNDRFCLIVMDIDNFKVVNDTHGHFAGDDALRLFVQTLKYETGIQDVGFRYGGEEFAILSRRNLDESFLLSCEIRKRFSEVTLASDLQESLTASAGICQYIHGNFSDQQEFFSAADLALYHAKNSGKNQSVIWVPNFTAQGLGTTKE